MSLTGTMILLFDNRRVSTENLDEVRFIASGETNELGDILDQSIADDLCHTRRSYNKNEVRFGSGGGAKSWIMPLNLKDMET